jgi:hypothetical protein
VAAQIGVAAQIVGVAAQIPGVAVPTPLYSDRLLGRVPVMLMLEHCRQTCVRDGAHGRNYPKHSRVANRRRPIYMAPICPARIASGRKVCFTRILAPSLSPSCTYNRINAIAITQDSAAAELRYIQTLCFLQLSHSKSPNFF